jgi:hypothetical protein
MLMRFRGGGVGHTSTRSATDRFLQDRDRLDQDSRTQGDGDESEGGFEDADDVDGEVLGPGGRDEEPGNGDDDDRSWHGGNEGPRTGDFDDNEGSGDEEEDYGYRYLVDDENDEDSDEPLDVVDDVLGPEDGEGDIDEVNLLGYAAF